MRKVERGNERERIRMIEKESKRDGESEIENMCERKR